MSKKQPEDVNLGKGEYRDVTPKKETKMPKLSLGNIAIAIVVVITLVAGGVALYRNGNTTPQPTATLAVTKPEAAKVVVADPNESRFKALEDGQKGLQKGLEDIAAYLKGNQTQTAANPAGSGQLVTNNPAGGSVNAPPSVNPAGGGDQEQTASPRRASPAEIAARAYESLGPAPRDGRLKNHQTVEGANTSFTCPDGSLAKTVHSVAEDGHGMNHARWACPHHD